MPTTEETRVYLFENLKIKQDTVFDFEELYQMLFRWFEIHEYDFYEKEYSKADRGQAADVTIAWHASKKGDDYVKYGIQLHFLVTGLQSIELEKEGLKIRTNKASLTLQMTAYIVKDPDNKTAKSLGTFGRNLYEKFIKERLQQHEVTLYNETHMLIDEIKSFLTMHQF